ncbi:PAS domain-containing sensor histidine kinase [Geofilum rubicundum]|uniref:histidine kinase n=1 Tax=Geofilum rubicundum JCM 15548 TaxID=1236989 RepID=A0A0E9LXG8_9BACT|nr:PAS domain-containing sensor histidine kinase [Geofilum rubicundum]GAO30277.1 response regulator/sensory box protein/GGDEF domain protein [Geofilum rubicundum JCM 15548]
MEYENLSREELIQELKHANALLMQFFNEKDDNVQLAWTGNLGHWYWDVKKNVVRFNWLKVKALGYSEAEVPENVGYEFFTEKIHPDDYTYVMENMAEHLKGATDLYEVEYRIQAKDGSWKWYYDRGAVTLHDDDGQPVLLMGMVFDTTEKKNKEEALFENEKQLKAALASRDKFMSIISHDLKSPFNSLMGFSSLLMDGSKKRNEETIEKYARLIYETSQNTFNLLLNLLEWSRFQTGNMTYKPEMVDVQKLVLDALSVLESQAVAKEIKISTRMDEGLSILVDPQMITTVLRNLISNAIKFTHKGGFVHVDVEQMDKDVRLAVSDNGVGIKADDLMKLFRVDSDFSLVGTSNEKGTGIGLGLCKEFVELHKGHIWVESEWGKGSTFIFVLPQ